MDMDESRQVDKRQMDAAEGMNSLEVGETASSPPKKTARLRKPLDGKQEKTGKDETEVIRLEDAVVMKSRGSSTGSSILDKCQPDREMSFHQLPEGNVPLYREAERVQRDEWVKSRGSFSSSTTLEKLKSLSSLRRLHGKLRGLCSLRRLHLAPLKNAGETASSTWCQFGALSTENEVGTRGNLDGTRQDSSEEGKWSWHDEVRPDSFASVVKDEEAPRRRPANISVQKTLGTQQMVQILTVSVDGTNQRFKEEVPGTPVLHMSGVSGAMSVPTASACRPSPLSQYYLLKHGCRATFRQSASGNWTFRAGVPITIGAKR